MKIEEAKDAIKVRSKAMTDINAKNSFGHIPCQQAIPVNEVINIIDKIELAPPKPEVQQFLADWYEEHKYDLESEIFRLIINLNSFDGELTTFQKWFMNNDDSIQTLINMHQFSYTVQKEKLYNVNVLGCTLFKMTSDNHVRYKLIGKNETPPESKFDSYEFEANLTEKEIKQADERLWQFAKSAF